MKCKTCDNDTEGEYLYCNDCQHIAQIRSEIEYLDYKVRQYESKIGDYHDKILKLQIARLNHESSKDKFVKALYNDFGIEWQGSSNKHLKWYY